MPAPVFERPGPAGSVPWPRYQAASSPMIWFMGQMFTPSLRSARWELRRCQLPSRRTRVPARVTAVSRRRNCAASSSQLEGVIIGTVLGDSPLDALRRLAEDDTSARHPVGAG